MFYMRNHRLESILHIFKMQTKYNGRSYTINTPWSLFWKHTRSNPKFYWNLKTLIFLLLLLMQLLVLSKRKLYTRRLHSRTYINCFPGVCLIFSQFVGHNLVVIKYMKCTACGAFKSQTNMHTAHNHTQTFKLTLPALFLSISFRFLERI